VERPPSSADWVHEIKFDGYCIQMRVENGAVTLKTRKGLDWTAKFGFAIPTAASQLPNCLIDGEIVVVLLILRDCRRPCQRARPTT
jgi:bifunctional non-homologous end joining protein LigD